MSLLNHLLGDEVAAEDAGSRGDDRASPRDTAGAAAVSVVICGDSAGAESVHKPLRRLSQEHFQTTPPQPPDGPL